MNRRHLLCALVFLTAASARAQFVGDAMAAAGLAEGEGELSLAAISAPPAPAKPGAPRLSGNLSTPSPSQNVSSPQPASGVTSVAGAHPTGTAAPRTATPGTVTPTPGAAAPLPPVEGSGYTIAGGGKVTSPEEAAAWKAAYKPLGASIDVLPPGHETVKGSWGTLEYSMGVFYRQQGNRWVVVEAPVGGRVKDRPAAAAFVVQGDVSYLYYNGTFFVWNRDAGACDVVKAPVGAVVTNVPESAVKQDKDGQPCFIYGGVCYRPTFRGQSLVYVVA
jgi:hypothetical protein